MTAKKIDGKAVAVTMTEQTRIRVERIKATTGIVPGLAVILVGDDPASQIYVRRKADQCRAIGMMSVEHRLQSDVAQKQLLDLVQRLNADLAVHGILVQLPLPAHITAAEVIEAIEPAKDVDGFHPTNIGRQVVGTGGVTPCTPMGCMILLKQEVPEMAGKDAIVIGMSNIVGKPLARLLLREECTVTVAHKATVDLREKVRRADIIVSAAGAPGLVKGSWIKPGAVVIDVGINRVERNGKKAIVGDVVYEEACNAAAITPVPGGVGPMTIACLLHNAVDAAERALGL